MITAIAQPTSESYPDMVRGKGLELSLASSLGNEPT